MSQVEKCKSCRKEFDPDEEKSASSSISTYIGIELGFLIFGGYAVTCYYFFSYTIAIIGSILVGALFYYLFLPEKQKYCGACAKKNET